MKKSHGGARKGSGRHPVPTGLRPGAGPDVMTLHALAEYLNCHYETALKLATKGDLPGFRLGGAWRFLKSEVDQWIARRQLKPERK